MLRKACAEADIGRRGRDCVMSQTIRPEGRERVQCCRGVLMRYQPLLLLLVLVLVLGRVTLPPATVLKLLLLLLLLLLLPHAAVLSLLLLLLQAWHMCNELQQAGGWRGMCVIKIQVCSAAAVKLKGGDGCDCKQLLDLVLNASALQRLTAAIWMRVAHLLATNSSFHRIAGGFT